MIAIIEYGAGNTASVANAVKDTGNDFIITDSRKVIESADKIIFPGVGEASSCLGRLDQLNLTDTIKHTKKPMLGICLGMQVFSSFMKEGDIEGLGIIDTICERFDSSNIKVPHMGWNSAEIKNESPLFKGINSGEHFYFANSFYVPEGDYSTAVTDYSLRFSAAVQKNNFYGVQFHPEKSGKAGINLLKNFIELC